jgi:hypothetical protein
MLDYTEPVQHSFPLNIMSSDSSQTDITECAYCGSKFVHSDWCPRNKETSAPIRPLPGTTFIPAPPATGDWPIIEHGLQFLANQPNGMSLHEWSLFSNAVLALKPATGEPPAKEGETP